jgi:uncharacterized protein (UPF0335 family)
MKEGNNSTAERNEYGARINNLHNQKDDIDQDIKDIYLEAKSKGIEVPVLKRAVKLLREDEEKKRKRLEIEEEAELVAKSLGEYLNTPLGQAAVRNVLVAG